MKEVEEEMEALVENYNAYVTEARAALEDLAFQEGEHHVEALKVIA